MGKQHNSYLLLTAAALFAVLLAAPASAQSTSEEGWGKFFQDKVSFAGFIENTTGLSIASGSRFTNTSNRFYMNRFTFQPEFNIQAADWAKFFISWRFVGEPRYSAETKSRAASVQPAGTGGPLPVEFYSEYKGVPWEAVADIYPADRLHIRMGRQFISWGETDGQRLIDLIDPQNLTFAPPAPNLFNLDETRIPQWGVRLLYTVRPVSNTILEFFANPGFEPKKMRVDNFSPTNDISDGESDGDQRYGRWSSHPEDRMPVARMFANPLGPVPVVVPLASRDYPDAGDSWKIGTRITHNFGALSAGLGYIFGYNPQASDMVFKTGAVSCLPPGVPPNCQIPFLPPGNFTPTTVQLRLVNDRTHIIAGHLNYPIDEPLGIPIKSAMRAEVAFYPNKPYNISEFSGINCVTGAPTRYALGFDRSTFIPFLQDDPWRAFRMTFQIFQSIILDHEKGIRTFGHASKINQVSTLLTFRVNTGYLGDTILPDIFVGYDPDGYYVVNPAVTYQPPWNEKLQLTLTSAIYGGHNKYKSLGFFSEKDSVFLKLRYQF
jgi:hypothetical protein